MDAVNLGGSFECVAGRLAIGHRVAADGLFRMTVQELLEVHLQHFCSEIDSIRQETTEQCGTRSDWVGYTEWVSQEVPHITIGWDWRLLCVWQGVAFTQEGAARTNLMLVDAQDRDLGWATNLKVLGTLVRSVDWEGPLKRALAQRYGP